MKKIIKEERLEKPVGKALSDEELNQVSGGLNDDLVSAVSNKLENWVYAGVVSGYKWYDAICIAQNAQTVEEYNSRVSEFAANNNLPPELFIL